jgi:hypothetical protein
MHSRLFEMSHFQWLDRWPAYKHCRWSRDKTDPASGVIPPHAKNVQITRDLRRRVLQRYCGLRRLRHRIVALDIGGGTSDGVGVGMGVGVAWEPDAGGEGPVKRRA